MRVDAISAQHFRASVGGFMAPEEAGGATTERN